jgi:hypothetical protein
MPDRPHDGRTDHERAADRHAAEATEHAIRLADRRDELVDAVFMQHIVVAIFGKLDAAGDRCLSLVVHAVDDEGSLLVDDSLGMLHTAHAVFVARLGGDL